MKTTVLKTSQSGVIGLGLALLLILFNSQGSLAAGSYPNSMVATGDSITRAFNSDPTTPLADVPAFSWSTGTDAMINSHYSRILAVNPAISGANYNDANDGDKMSNLAGQMNTVNSQHVDYVTIEMGANDVCTGSEANMTSVANFQQQFQTALTTLANGSPDTRIFVASIPNVYNVWLALHTDPNAVNIWNTYGICQSMLANPTSTAQPDEDRRQRVLQREVDFNTALAQVCAGFVHCRFDNNAVFNAAFTASDASPIDYYHPSKSGQTKLAAGTWAATFDFTDSIAPSSIVTVTNPGPNEINLSFGATDNAGVSGVEYKIDGGSWAKYTQTVTLTATNISLSYRAVDINGNSEPAHTVWVVGSNQTFSTSLSNAQPGDTIAFASSDPQSLNSANITFPAKVKVVGTGCGASASTINYTGSSSTSTFNLGGGDSLSGLNLQGFHLVASTTNGKGANLLSCVVVNATRISV